MFRSLANTLRRAGVVPKMSDTERAALDAGDTWLEADLFAGRYDANRALAEPYPDLTDEERAFLDGPVEEVCRAIDPQELERTRELPERVWRLLKEHRFFGLAFPKEYGGHEFSALAQSTIFGKLGSRSMPLSSVVLIPNSVGPGELLLEVGTQEQRDYYLPRLARGDEIPCFALTEPNAGSDAASLTSKGVVFKDSDGELKIRLDWEKRYITLAPISTLLGLAVRLYDPDRLIGEEEDLGITCVMVPTDLPGVEIGRRHDPMGIPFPNGPTSGRDVVVGIDQIIGGRKYAGKGWQMLMEALSGGRAVSLPAQATAGAKSVAHITGAYAVVRRQFGLPIGRFEGVEEALARIAGKTYLLEAARVFTCGALASGHRPAVVSAMIKYNATATSREVVTDGMDVLGGAAICRGPRNLIAQGWTTTPIGITVEGANILTRTLIVFGQGALRCHPHLHDLSEGIRTGDVPRFRRAFLGQIAHVTGLTVRGAFHTLTRGLFAGSAGSADPRLRRYHRRLAWSSVRYAFWANLTLLLVGGKLKFRGQLTGRFADALSWMYLTLASLRRFEAEGRQDEDLPLARWSAEYGLHRVQESFEGILANLGGPLGWLWRGPARWMVRLSPVGRESSDTTGSHAAQAILNTDARRDRLTNGLYVHPGSHRAHLEETFRLSLEADPHEQAVRRAQRKGSLPDGDLLSALDVAVDVGVIDASGAELVRRAVAARDEAVKVDDFSLEELRGDRANAQLEAAVA